MLNAKGADPGFPNFRVKYSLMLDLRDQQPPAACLTLKRFAFASAVGAIALLLLMTGCTSLRKFGRSDKSEEDPYAAVNVKRTNGNGVQNVSYEEDGDAVKPIELNDFNPKNLNATTKRLTGRGPNRKIAEQSYREGDELYKQAVESQGDNRGDLFALAAKKFLVAADRMPNSAVEQDALFMAGESFFFADYYSKANDVYERLIKAHPNNRYLDTIEARRFAIAKYWLEVHRKNPESFFGVNMFDELRPWRDTRGHGLRVFDRIRVDDPTGRLADDATFAAANEHFANRNFLKADDYYTDLRSAYPSSEHQFSAHFLGLKAKLNTYMGAGYSGTMLDEGEKLVKQMRRQFPRESEGEREFLERAAAEIRFKKGERYWKMAEYHKRRGENRAALHYLAKIDKDYSDTPFGERALAMRGEVKDLPAVPAQKMKWLVDLIPQKDNVEQLLKANQENLNAPAIKEAGVDAPQMANPPQQEEYDGIKLR